MHLIVVFPPLSTRLTKLLFIFSLIYLLLILNFGFSYGELSYHELSVAAATLFFLFCRAKLLASFLYKINNER